MSWVSGPAAHISLRHGYLDLRFWFLQRGDSLAFRCALYVPSWACWPIIHVDRLMVATPTSFRVVLMAIIEFSRPLLERSAYVTTVSKAPAMQNWLRVSSSSPALTVPRSGHGRARETENLFRLPVIIPQQNEMTPCGRGQGLDVGSATLTGTPCCSSDIRRNSYVWLM